MIHRALSLLVSQLPTDSREMPAIASSDSVSGGGSTLKKLPGRCANFYSILVHAVLRSSKTNNYYRTVGFEASF